MWSEKVEQLILSSKKAKEMFGMTKNQSVQAVILCVGACRKISSESCICLTRRAGEIILHAQFY